MSLDHKPPQVEDSYCTAAHGCLLIKNSTTAPEARKPTFLAKFPLDIYSSTLLDFSILHSASMP